MKNHPNNSTATCRKCSGKMIPSIAIQSTLVASIGDFHESDYCTYHEGGPGRVIAAMKCERCGWSVTRC